MLVVRDAQLRAMEALDQQALAERVRIYLNRKHPGALPPEEAGPLVSTSIATCLAHGFDQEGAILEFAEAMLLNSRSPRSPVELQAATGSVRREFEARKIALRLAAIKGAVRETTEESGT